MKHSLPNAITWLYYEADRGSKSALKPDGCSEEESYSTLRAISISHVSFGAYLMSYHCCESDSLFNLVRAHPTFSGTRPLLGI
jgi:hypothetical protein